VPSSKKMTYKQRSTKGCRKKAITNGKCKIHVEVKSKQSAANLIKVDNEITVSSARSVASKIKKVNKIKTKAKRFNMILNLKPLTPLKTKSKKITGKRPNKKIIPLKEHAIPSRINTIVSKVKKKEIYPVNGKKNNKKTAAKNGKTRRWNLCHEIGFTVRKIERLITENY